MSEDHKISRRKLVKVSGASLATALVAGCGGNGGGEGTTGSGEGTTPGGEETMGEETGTAETETAETGTAETETAETGTAETETATPAESFVLGGEQSGWQGQEPQAIAGETNPTLSMEAGTTYEITWENLDGTEHELIIETESGEQLAATESASEQGATRSLTFEATTEAASYYCEYHPESMRGDVSVSEAETETAETGTAETTTSS